MGENKEKVVKEELLAMLKEKLKADVDEAALDDIVLSYVVGILEDVTVDGDDDDDLDVAAFLEMLAAYLPGAEAIPEADMSLWLRRVAKRLHESANAAKRESKRTFDISSLIRDPQPKMTSAGSASSKPRHASSSSTSSAECNPPPPPSSEMMQPSGGSAARARTTLWTSRSSIRLWRRWWRCSRTRAGWR